MVKKVLSRNAVKLFATAAMALDHMSTVMSGHWNPELCHAMRFTLGRAAYPLFLVLFIEGMMRTENPLRHVRDLILFAVVAEPFSDMALYGTWYYPEWQNVMWSWAISGLMLAGIRAASDSARDGRMSRDVAVMYCLAAAFVGNMAGIVFYTDYGACHGALTLLVWGVMSYRRDVGWLNDCRHALAGILISVMLIVGYSTPGALICVPVLLAYDPDRTCRRGSGLKYAGYAFYPGHMAALSALRLWVSG